MIRIILTLLAWGLSFTADSAVIMQYHHVSSDTPAITSVSPKQFKAHMQYLAQEGFQVVPLSTIVESIRKGQDLPEKTVAITFDDGYQNIADNAHPILKEYGFPYTLFVATDPIEKNYSEMMSWETLLQLTQEGAELANHTLGHEHLLRRLEGEDKVNWLKRIESNVLETESLIAQKTGVSLKILAYPYGEYNSDIQNLLKQHGYAAVGQQSGAAGPYSDLTAIPRFPVAGPYAKLQSLKVKLHSLNMPVLSISPAEPELGASQWRPTLTVTLDMTDIAQQQVMCFIQGQGAKQPTWINKNQFSIQADTDLSAGRSRYNCTSPSRATGNYYWFSQPWFRPLDNGEWPAE
ncbi:polysaccharide deacetylase family protein [Shewanella gelidii]|uniref:Polysaccharide deacetylase n=1 Tax=Shewanella gelidii TaxID=1642821 RepID=A0A917JTQ3_9GAMM|nr:polysaccharide deacetylase family protein [Shewanella gelidii]MCL1099105.1 polysaccharide deacetylase family protein [Shewanella gelidii]GGI81728.1 polysaccharide deacetylase [Shewanella gelidii]